jgi:hypothetical protein
VEESKAKHFRRRRPNSAYILIILTQLRLLINIVFVRDFHDTTLIVELVLPSGLFDVQKLTIT